MRRIVVAGLAAEVTRILPLPGLQRPPGAAISTGVDRFPSPPPAAGESADSLRIETPAKPPGFDPYSAPTVPQVCPIARSHFRPSEQSS